MHDLNNVELARGDVLTDGKQFIKIFNVGEEVCVMSLWHTTQETAEKYEGSFYNFTQSSILSHKLVIVSRRHLGVFDSQGKEYHYGDEIELSDKKRMVFEEVRNRENNDGYILFENKNNRDGWSLDLSTAFTLIRPDWSKKSAGKKVKVKLTGGQIIEMEGEVVG